MSDIGNFKKALSGLAPEGEGTVDQLTDVPVNHSLAADGAANTAISATKIFCNPFDFTLRIARAVVSPDAAVAEDATNNAVITLSVDDGANGAPETAATVDSDVGSGGNWAADTAKEFTLSAGGVLIAPGANLFLAQTKGGTGVQLPARTVALRLRRV